MKLPTIPSDGFLKALPDAERKKLGRAGMTSEEAQAKFARGQEKKLQDLIAAALNLAGIYYVRSRMDRKTTTAKGTPDFIICYKGRFIACECKAEGGKLTREQEFTIVQVGKNDGMTVVARTLNDLRAVLKQIDQDSL